MYTCSCPAGYVANDEDCDDADPDVHPGVEEVPCNGVDDDCEGGAPLETDDDGDGLAECEGDCVDSSADAYPGGVEICDGLDDDCDGALPDDEADLDGDGEMACAGDCDDTDRTYAHANIEVCDGLDNDCDGTADDACYSCDLAVPNNFATVQEGIDGAVSGDVVCVGPGTWEESIDFNGATITLRGVAGPAATILDGDGPVVIFHSGETAATELQGFTVTRGEGGIDISGASPSLSDLVITDNDGIGISVLDGAPSLTRLIISENGGSVGDPYEAGGLYVYDSEAMLEDVLIQLNLGRTGGGLNATNSAISLVNVTIRGNESWGDDGGAGAYFLTSVAELTNVLVTDNFTSSGYAGGLLLDDSSATLTNVEV